MNEGLVSNKFEEYIKEIQGVLALGYVFLVIIGMINEFVFYQTFNVNIFQYSEIWDFLIAPFKRVQSIIFLTISVVFSYLGYMLDVYLERKWPKLHYYLSFGAANKKWFKTQRVIMTLIAFLFLLIYYSNISSKAFKANIIEQKNHDVEIVFDSKSQQKVSANYIGSNSNYLFILNKEKQVEIIPIHSKIERIVRK